MGKTELFIEIGFVLFHIQMLTTQWCSTFKLKKTLINTKSSDNFEWNLFVSDPLQTGPKIPLTPAHVLFSSMWM